MIFNCQQNADCTVHSTVCPAMLSATRYAFDNSRNIAWHLSVNEYQLSLRAQALLQTQQIDSAILLLKNQYAFIMQSVHQPDLLSSAPSPSNQFSAAQNFAGYIGLPDTTETIENFRSSSLNRAKAPCSRKRKEHYDEMLTELWTKPNNNARHSGEANKRAR